MSKVKPNPFVNLACNGKLLEPTYKGAIVIAPNENIRCNELRLLAPYITPYAS